MFCFTSNQTHFLHLPYNSICYLEMNKRVKSIILQKVALFELLLARRGAGEPSPIDFSKFNESALSYG